MANPHLIKVEGRVTTQVQDDQGTHYTNVTYLLTLDAAAIATHLTQRALVSHGRPKRATGLQEAAVLVIKEVESKEL